MSHISSCLYTVATTSRKSSTRVVDSFAYILSNSLAQFQVRYRREQVSSEETRKFLARRIPVDDMEYDEHVSLTARGSPWPRTARPRPHSASSTTQRVLDHTARPRPHSVSTTTQRVHDHTARPRPHSASATTQRVHDHTARPRPHSASSTTQRVHDHTARPRPHSASTTTQRVHDHTARPRPHSVSTTTQRVHDHTARPRSLATRRHPILLRTTR